jgi:ribosomal protein S18 acetylase RimI-like enzyme
MSFHIRPYQTKDHNDVYTICLKTGDAGSDASNLYKDPNLLGHIYAGPYINLEPESAFMLEDEIGICGYIIGALDTQSFFNKVKSNWLPALQKQYTEPSEDSKPWTKDEECIHLLFHPEKPELFPDYPSHLHIDLLNRAQGQGQGKIMMDHFMHYLQSQGSQGFHLGLGINNKRAFHFYKKYGLVELMRNDETIFMGLSLE